MSNFSYCGITTTIISRNNQMRLPINLLIIRLTISFNTNEYVWYSLKNKHTIHLIPLYIVVEKCFLHIDCTKTFVVSFKIKKIWALKDKTPVFFVPIDRVVHKYHKFSFFRYLCLIYSIMRRHHVSQYRVIERKGWLTIVLDSYTWIRLDY